MANPTEILRAENLPRLTKFWKDVWGKQDSLKRELKVSDGDVGHYLDFGEHFLAVNSFCTTVPDKLYVQQEYVAAYNTFTNNSVNRYERGACIIGQPGIGKSCFIAYAVVERLRNKKPVAVEVGHWDETTKQYLLFSAEGVTLHFGAERVPLRGNPGIWAFSDSNEYTLIPMAAFRITGARVFQVTSPKEVRHKEWTKQRGIARYIMDLPSEKDIEYLSRVLGKDAARMKALAGRWGPIPRTLLLIDEYLCTESSHMKGVRAQVEDSVHNIDKVLAILSQLDNIGAELASTVFFVTPDRDEDHRLDHQLTVPTTWLRQEVMNGLLRRKDAERIQLYNVMMGSVKGRSAVAGFFEAIVHRFISRGNELSVRWYVDKDSPGPSTPLNFGVLATLTATVGLRSAHDPFYWRPESSTFPGIDCAIITEDCIYVIQVTTALTHNFADDSLSKFLDALPPDREGSPVKFLVVGRTERQTAVVTNNMFDKVRSAREQLPIGGITFGVDMVSSRHMGSPEDIEEMDTS